MSRWRKRSPMTADMYNEKVLSAAGINTQAQSRLHRAKQKQARHAAAYGVQTIGANMAAQQLANSINRDIVAAMFDNEQAAFERDAEEALKRHNGKIRAEELMAMGYRRTSNRHRIVSRIDRPDWALPIAQTTSTRSVDVIYADPSCWEDYYRRCCSKDKITIDSYTSAHMKGSSGQVTGYIELGERIANDTELE
jgi:hypothetical protein